MSYKIFCPIHKEGYLPVGILLVAACVSFAVSFFFGVLVLLATASCAFFFRDPNRVSPLKKSLILSPADGLIYKIDKYEDCTRISIFLSVMNVHVNRVPVSGTVKQLKYNPGKFTRASSHKDSEENENQEIIVESEDGVEIRFSQIAGFIARRIICNLKEGEEVIAGKRFGIIKFGSRMDVMIPQGINVLVTEGQTMVGGETILADLSNQYPVCDYQSE